MPNEQVALDVMCPKFIKEAEQMVENDSSNNGRFKDMFIKMAPNLKNYVVHRFEDMEEFKHFTLAAILDEKKSISGRFQRDTENLSEKQKQEYFEYNSEDYFMVEDVFTQISLRSFVVILFSYIEDGMNTLCNATYSDKARYHKKKSLESFDVKYTDMQGKGITRAKLYLEKIIGCNLHTEKKPWSEIETLRKIRNAIVHEDGHANDNLKKDGNFKQHAKHDYFKVEHHGNIVIKPEYLDYILPQVREYFNGIELK